MVLFHVGKYIQLVDVWGHCVVAVWQSAGLVIGGMPVRISAGATSHQGRLLSLPSLRGRKMSTSYSWEGKGRYGSFRFRMNMWVAGKTVKSLENTCHTWVLLQWWFTTKRRYIKCMDLLPLNLIISSVFGFKALPHHCRNVDIKTIGVIFHETSCTLRALRFYGYWLMSFNIKAKKQSKDV